VHLLNLICYCALAVAIIALPFVLVNWWNSLRKEPVSRLPSARSQFPTKSVSVFVISILVAITASSLLTTYARRNTLGFLQKLSGNYIVYINQQPVDDSDRIISALKQIAPYWAHHSHPTKRIRVDIRSDTSGLTLELGRDSDNPQEYWVFYSESGVTSNNEIGRITTPVFDGY